MYGTLGVKNVSIKSETELYEPIKMYFEKQNYEVQAEVKDCDLVARKEDEIILVELKKSFCLKLVYQAMERQKLSECVYVAIPMPKGGSFKKSWHQMVRLLKAIRVGLITVNASGEVKIHIEPKEYVFRKNYKKKKKLVREADERITNINVGGTRGKTMTVYKEQSLIVAYSLSKVDKIKSAELSNLLNMDKARAILTKNYHGWFDRVDRGVYSLNAKGKKALQEYDLAEQLYDNWMASK